MRGCWPLVVLFVIMAVFGFPGKIPVSTAPILSHNVSEPIGALPVPTMLQAASVTVIAGESMGSGFIVVRAGRVFVWTARHVIDKETTVGVFHDFISNGNRFARRGWVAHVIKADEKADLALLEVDHFAAVLTPGVEFYSGPVPAVGTEICHVGSFFGERFPGSYSTGVISAVGRFDGDGDGPFDQVSCPAFPGSSGGGVFLMDGRCIGMLVRQSASTLDFLIPVRVIREWAKQNAVEFAL